MLNKKKAILLTSLLLAATMMGCSSHKHNTEEKWECDAAQHWKVCSEDGEKIEVGKHTLNEDSHCTKCDCDVYDFGDSVSVYCYDDKGNATRLADYDADGNLVSDVINEYEYDADGNIIKEAQFIDGVLCSTMEYAVKDGESVTVKFIAYYEDSSYAVSEYDEYGNITKTVLYDADGKVQHESFSEYVQNSEGEWYEAKLTEKYENETIVAEYNEMNEIIKRTIYDADGNIVSEETEFEN